MGPSFYWVITRRFVVNCNHPNMSKSIVQIQHCHVTNQKIETMPTKNQPCQFQLFISQNAKEKDVAMDFGPQMMRGLACELLSCQQITDLFFTAKSSNSMVFIYYNTTCTFPYVFQLSIYKVCGRCLFQTGHLQLVCVCNDKARGLEKHKTDTYCDEVVPCAQNIDIVQGSIINTMGLAQFVIV